MKKLTLIFFVLVILFGCKNEDPSPSTTSAVNDSETNSLAITDFSPTTGGSGTEIKINGNNFESIDKIKVYFNGIQAEIVAASSTEITVKVPTEAISGKITVTSGSLKAISEKDFIVMPSATQATVTSFEPKKGGVGTVVTINGTNFSSMTLVVFKTEHSTVNARIISASSTELKVVVPHGAVTGPISIITQTTAGSVTIDSFEASPLEIELFSPVFGYSHQNITLTGIGFSTILEENVVKISEVNARVISVSSAGLTIEVPEEATTGYITLTVNGFSTTSFKKFEVAIKQTITSITPMEATPGTQVTIIGTNFNSYSGGMTQVKFNNSFAKIIAQTNEEIVVEIPQGARTGRITVYKNIVNVNDYMDPMKYAKSSEDFKILE